MRRVIILLVSIIMLWTTASADMLLFPDNLITIEDEAFRGDTSIGEVILPEGIERIGAYVFADSTITRLYLPGSLTSINDTAFDNCCGLVCWGPTGTYAETFCKNHGIDFESGTAVYRALLIGEVNYAIPLNGPDNDISCMEAILNGMGWDVFSQQDATANELYDLVEIAFSEATDEDVSLFYYSGHGVTGSSEQYSGALQTVENQYITTQDLAGLLAAIPGRVIVILDSCGSGAAISDGTRYLSGEPTGFDPKQFNASVISAFRAHDSELDQRKEADETEGSIQLKAGELRQTKFHVLTSSAYEENSATVYQNGAWGGALTRAAAEGLGCGYPGGSYSGSMPADTNTDSKINLSELAVFCKQKVIDKQNVLSYSASPYYSIFIR